MAANFVRLAQRFGEAQAGVFVAEAAVEVVGVGAAGAGLDGGAVAAVGEEPCDASDDWGEAKPVYV